MLYKLSNFTTYNSPVGFTISYPNNWTTKNVKGVDTSFGGVQILSPGTSIKGESFAKGDKIENLITIGVLLTEKNGSFEEYKQFFKNDIKELDTPTFSRKIIESKDIKINGKDVFEIVTLETIKTGNNLFKRIQILLPADTSSLKNKTSPLGTIIILDYRSSPGVFNQNLAEQIFSTFKDRVLETKQ